MMELLTYMCVILCSLYLVQSQIIIPPELRSHYGSSGMEFEDFIEQIILSLDAEMAAAAGIEAEEPEPGQPPEPTLSPSFLNPNSSLMASLKNGSLGFSLLDLAEIEELPPTPEPAPITPAPPTLAPVTIVTLTNAILKRLPANLTSNLTAIHSMVQVNGSNPYSAQTAIRDLQATVPLNHGVLTLNFHSFIEKNTARNSSLGGQPPPDLFAPSPPAAQSNNSTVGNQTSAVPVNHGRLTIINPTESPPSPSPVQILTGRPSPQQVGALSPVQVQVEQPSQVQIQTGQLSPVQVQVERPSPVQVGQLSPLQVAVEQPSPVQIQTGRPSPVQVAVEQPSLVQIQTGRPSLAQVQVERPSSVQIGQLSPLQVAVEQPSPVQIQTGRPSPVQVQVERPSPAQVQVGQLSPLQVAVDQPSSVRIQTGRPSPEQVQVGRLSQIGTTKKPQVSAVVPELSSGTGGSTGQGSVSAQPSSNSQAQVYHGILTLHYESYIPAQNSTRQRNGSRAAAAATDGFSSGLGSIVGINNPSVSGQGTVTLTDPLSPSSNNGQANATTPQNSETLDGLSSLISSMIARNRATAPNQGNRISLNPAVDLGRRPTSVSISSQLNNSDVVASNLTAPTTPATVSRQDNLESNTNGQNAVVVTESNISAVVSNQSQANVRPPGTQTPAPFATNASIEILPTNITGQNIPQESVSSWNSSEPRGISSSSGVSQAPIQNNTALPSSVNINETSSATTNSTNTNLTVSEVELSLQAISLGIPNTNQSNFLSASGNVSADSSIVNAPTISSSNVIVNGTGNAIQMSGDQLSPQLLPNFNDMTTAISTDTTRSNGTISNSTNAISDSNLRSIGQATNASRAENIPPGNLSRIPVIFGQNTVGISDTLSENSTGTSDLTSQNSTVVLGISSPSVVNSSVLSSQDEPGGLIPLLVNSSENVKLSSNNSTESPLPDNTPANDGLQLLQRNSSTALDLALGPDNTTLDSQPPTTGSSASIENSTVVSDVLSQNSNGGSVRLPETPRRVVQIPTLQRPAAAVPLAGSGAALKERSAEMHLPGWKWAMNSGASNQIHINIVNILLLLLTSVVFLFH